MNGGPLFLIGTLARNEMRLRLRRVSTVVVLLAVIVLSSLIIPDPHKGTALLMVGTTRVLYTSSALALGSAQFAGLLFGLAGFFLVRGRMAEDLRSGIGGVIAASPVGKSWFLAGRWLGGVAYLGAMVLAFMGATMVCHVLRGDGPVEPLVYLQTYALVLLPMVFFGVSCALLFDSWAPLMGKVGDVLFFFCWVAQVSMASQVDQLAPGAFAPWMLFDFSGNTMAVMVLTASLGTVKVSIGICGFDPAMAPIVLPPLLWSARVGVLRCVTMALALLPLLPAMLLFHRYSPDRVRAGSARLRRSPLAVLNGMLRPLARLVQPLFRLAGRVPGFGGQVLADLALTLVGSPSAVLALLLMLAASLLAPAAALPGLLACAVAFWAVSVSDTSVRDYAAVAEDLTGVVRGGARRRYLRQLASTALSGVLLTGVIGVRWAVHAPLRAFALAGGVFALSALATLAGRCSRTARTFVCLFLFTFYVAANAPAISMLDMAGFNGSATPGSVALWVTLGLAAALGGYTYNRRQAR